MEEKIFINHIKEAMKGNYIIHTGQSLQKFFEESFQNCNKINENFHDLFSTLEQEICYRSNQFLYSTGSSWSLNIVQERFTIGFGEDKNLENINLIYKALNVEI